MSDGKQGRYAAVTGGDSENADHVYVLQNTQVNRVPLKKSMIAKKQQHFLIQSTQRAPSQLAVDHLLAKTANPKEIDNRNTGDNSSNRLKDTPYLQGQPIRIGTNKELSQQLNGSHSTKFLNSFVSQSVKGTLSESKKTNVFIANAPSMLSNKSKPEHFSKLVKKSKVSNTNMRNALLGGRDSIIGNSAYSIQTKGFKMDVGIQQHMH